jgi:hypothetical protein
MSTMPSTSTIVGVFRDRATAEQAMEELRNTGFDRDQIRYAGPGTVGSFLDDIKSLFTGPNASGSVLANDLSNMGLSDEEARCYANEYNNGNSILAVNATGREQDAANILHKYGAYNYGMTPGFRETRNNTQQPSEYSQPGNYTTSNENTVAQPHNLQAGEVQEPGVVTTEHDDDTARQHTQFDTVPGEYDTAPQNAQPDIVTTEHDTALQHTQPDTVPSEYDTAPQGSQPDAVSAEDDTAAQHTQPDTTPTEYATPPQSTQSDAVPSEYGTSSQSTQSDVVPTEYNTGFPNDQPYDNQSDHEAELQHLQAQIEAAQQQLQETKVQLQAAKERAAHLQAAREREAQLQEARQHLQEVQAELQAALAELRETQERIAQHQ